MTYQHVKRWLFTLLTATAICGNASAATRTWITAGAGAWEDGANWGGTAPQAGDDVVITNAGASVLLSDATPTLKSVTLSRTLTFTNWTTSLTASNVAVQSGGILRPITGFLETEMSNRVYVVCSNLTVESGGQIHADGLGFRGEGATVSGEGAGVYGNNRGSGGSYGGRGGMPNGRSPVPPDPYGSAAAPVDPGSSGGKGHVSGQRAGNGGGAIRIVAGNVTVNGTVSANGATGETYAGAGSGGGIYITCAAFAATGGVIRADGGVPANSLSGRGGGGRISIDCPNLAEPLDISITAKTGAGIGNEGQMGTLYLRDASSLSGLFYRCDRVRIVVGGLTNWAVDSLTLTNRSLGLGENDFTLTVTNDLTIGANAWLTLGGEAFLAGEAKGVTGVASSPDISVGGKVLVNGGMLTIGGQDQDGRGLFDVGGNLVVTNGGGLFVYSGPTNGVNTTNGMIVTVAGNTRVVGSGSWVFPYMHRTNGGAALFRLNDLIVESGCGFDAEEKGYAWMGPSFNLCYAPDYGGSSGNRAAGSGHGGKGGDKTGSWPATGGETYGSSNAPVLAGAPGGFGYISGWAYPGGGSVQIAAGDVTLDGTINVDAGDGGALGGGGGGGGIFITCDTLAGAAGALLTADGGNGGSDTLNGGCGGGGGGRIAVGVGMPAGSREALIGGQTVDGLVHYYSHVGFDGEMSVTNGNAVGDFSDDGEPGTGFFLTAGKYTLTINGNPGTYDSPSPNGYGTHTDMSQGAWVTNTVNSPADEATGTRHACLGWTLADNAVFSNGLSTQVVFQLTTNLTLTWFWTNEYKLALSSATPSNGSVNTVLNGWYTNATVVTGITATASNGYAFSQWANDVPLGHENDNPLTVTMDQPRTLAATFGSASGETKTWMGIGDWTSATNWTPPGPPGVNDRAHIAAGTVTVSQVASVGSLTVSNGTTVIFTNWTTHLIAGEVRVEGCMRPAAPCRDTGPTNRVYLVCSNLLVAAGGCIEADGMGYMVDGLNVYGPGAGVNGGNRGSGGSYGGLGGKNSGFPGTTGSTYGSPEAPTVGSAGGYGYTPTPSGGSGGGAITIVATNVTVNGTISANGANVGTYHGGGGSGGGISIVCVRFAGTGGVVRADGGEVVDATAGVGGGGRIAIACPTFVRPLDVRFTTLTGAGGGNKGQMGTLYFFDTGILTTTLDQFDGVRLSIPGFTSWSPDNLTVTNGSVSLSDGAFSLDVTNDLVVAPGAWLSVGGVAFGEGESSGVPGGATSAVVRVGGNVRLPGGMLTVGGQDQSGRTVLDLQGKLELTDGGKLFIYSGPTNGVEENGGTLTVAGEVSIGTANSWIYPYAHQTNGGALLFALADLTIAAGCGIDATAKGYAWIGGVSYAPSVGASSGNRGAGSGHGGKGGDKTGANPAAGGGTYGYSNAPVNAGSPGGYGYFSGYAEPGGGVVRVNARQVTVNGTIAAGGGTGRSLGGGSSGGSILVVCDRLAGGAGGLIEADGGNSGTDAVGCGGGGGGRIALAIGFLPGQVDALLSHQPVAAMVTATSYERFSGAMSVTNGTATGAALPGEPGTALFLIAPPKGSLFLIR